MPNKIEIERSTPINIGISEKDRKSVCKGLNKLLADSYLLYLKTQNYHWNVTGKMFQSLHTLFEEQYLEQALSQEGQNVSPDGHGLVFIEYQATLAPSKI